MSVCHTSTGLCADELKAAETRAPRNELQPFRNAPVRVVVEMAAVPCLEAHFIAPVRKKPYLAGIVAGRDHLHPQETAGGVDQMRTIDKSILDLIGHSVRDSKPTQRDEFGAGLLCRAARRTVHSCPPFESRSASGGEKQSNRGVPNSHRYPAPPLGPPLPCADRATPAKVGYGATPVEAVDRF